MKRWRPALLLAPILAASSAAAAGDASGAAARPHWAFRPLTRPPIPTVRDAGGVLNPIDAFLQARREELGFDPLPLTPLAAVVRRAFIDLTGLPPTREELRQVLAEDAAGAYERTVDRLLASPRHGERWGRHWMDVWRYSDWYGRRTVPDVLNSYGQIWRWRDWIVRSLNEDAGYDRMVRCMLAGDELEPEDEGSLAATGFLVRNWYRWNYNSWMKDQVEHTAKAFLGLTINCAHCHDHKYDPITQEEYFKLRACFEPLELRHDRVAGEPDPGPFPKYVYGASYRPITSGRIRVFDEKLDAQTFLYTGGESRNIVADRPPVPPGAPAALDAGDLVVEPIDLPAAAWYPGLQPFVQAEELDRVEAAAAKAAAELEGLRAAATAGDEPLAGRQSLLLDAAMGRRLLAFAPQGPLLGATPDEVSFRLAILQDGHTNFQLGIDLQRGSTGVYLGFEGGRIETYRPRSFDAVEIGRYDLAAERRMHVRLRLDRSRDIVRIELMRSQDRKRLVDGAEGALHGWDPATQPSHGIFIDARPGTVAAYDDIAIGAAGAAPALSVDFEPPAWTAGADAASTTGWRAHSLSAPPATSTVAARLARPASAGELELAAARLAAARTELESVQARIAADRARLVERSADAPDRAIAASRAERRAALAVATVRELGARRALATATDPAAPRAALAKESAAVAAAAAALEPSSSEYSPLGPVYPRRSTGRRAALARWITGPRNPLAARVAVNHIWGRHFGRPIVETTSNLGRSGAAPSHPALLDWLAVELIESGWSMKHIHRLIVTSAAYRLAASPTPSGHPAPARDPENRFVWRWSSPRVEAEVVRDAVLHLAGELDCTLGGPDIDPALGAKSHRRSMYFTHHGEGKMELLEIFDGPSPVECYERTSSMRPQQALAFTNGELARTQGRVLAGRLWVASRGVPAGTEREASFVAAAFEQILGRLPTAAEARAASTFLHEQAAGLQTVPDPEGRARAGLIQALFSHHELVTVR